jgi:ParB-like chromosome segregation protein Spo0J
MKIEEINIDDVIPYHNNPRKNQAVDKVASSLSEFGFQQPIVVDKNMVVIVGHTRLLSAKKLGMKKVPVFIADLTEAKAKAYRIADNRLSEDSDWDYDFLNIEMNMLKEENFDLGQLGFSEEELDRLIADEEDFEPSDIDDQGEIDNPAKKCESCGQTLPQ